MRNKFDYAMIAAAALGASAALAFGAVSVAKGHHAPPPVPRVQSEVDRSYLKLHAAARSTEVVKAGRNVVLHGRPSDGRRSHSLTRREWQRLWVGLHPAQSRAHERRVLINQLGPIRAYAYRQVRRRWGTAHWPALDSLWSRESSWNPRAHNPSSGACHIPQALPCSKIPGGLSAHYTVAIDWGLDYIGGRYGNPSGAWAHFLANNYY